MSLYGYKPKTKKAPWTTAFPKQSAKKSDPPKRIRSVSKRRCKTNTAYRLKARMFLAMHPVCAVCCLRSSTEVHHTRGRADTLLLDERFWMPVDHDCHRAIHDHIDDARRSVWTRPDGTTIPMIAARGDWGRNASD